MPWRTWVFHWQCQQGVAEDTGSFEAQQTRLQILAPLLQASHWTSLSLTFPVVKWGTILLSCTVIRKMKCLVYNKLLLLIWMWVYKSVLNSLLLFLEQFTLLWGLCQQKNEYSQPWSSYSGRWMVGSEYNVGFIASPLSSNFLCCQQVKCVQTSMKSWPFLWVLFWPIILNRKQLDLACSCMNLSIETGEGWWLHLSSGTTQTVSVNRNVFISIFHSLE